MINKQKKVYLFTFIEQYGEYGQIKNDSNRPEQNVRNGQSRAEIASEFKTRTSSTR